MFETSECEFAAPCLACFMVCLASQCQIAHHQPITPVTLPHNVQHGVAGEPGLAVGPQLGPAASGCRFWWPRPAG